MSARFHSAFAEIDLNRLSENIDYISSVADVPLMPVIKANAYGHGVELVAKHIARRKDVIALAIGTVGEGIKLRTIGVKGRIVLLDGVLPEQAKLVVENKLEAVVSSTEEVCSLTRFAGRLSVPVHVKINTGMGRLGVAPDEAFRFYKEVSASKKIAIKGLMTHLAGSDLKKGGGVNDQLSCFDEVTSAIKGAGYAIPPRHCANTAGIFLHPKSRYDLVRPGIGIYGITRFRKADAKLKPVMSLKAKIVHVREVKKGETVSYGGEWKSPGRRSVAVVSIGYADGYSRGLSGKAHAIINGMKIRQIGVICMDNCMFDVTGTGAKTGDVVTLIGEDEKLNITANDIAKLVGTISYEILCGIGNRVFRLKRGF